MNFEKMYTSFMEMFWIQNGVFNFVKFRKKKAEKSFMGNKCFHKDLFRIFFQILHFYFVACKSK